MKLATSIILVLQIIGYTVALALINVDDVNINFKIKRSPANGFSLFGLTPQFSVSNTVSRAQQSFNTVSQLFNPTKNQHKIQENIYIPEESSRVVFKNRPEFNDVSTYVVTRRDPYVRETTEKSPTNILLDSNRPSIVFKPDYGNNVAEDGKDNHGNYAKGQSSYEKETINNGYLINDSSNEINKELINSIFNNINSNDVESTTTIEDVNIDYTTGTGDYETSTPDDLLRIPPAAVATLLGK